MSLGTKYMISHEKLLSLLDYDPETGVFSWRVSRKSYGGGKNPGDRAGTAQTGCRVITIDQVRYKEHRLAWFYVYGEWPGQEIDHINRDFNDNRVANLRLATRSQNSANMVKPRAASSGYKGVYQNRHSPGTWFAQISVDSKSKFLGRFTTPEEAHAAYVAAAQEHYGDFARIS